MRATRLGKIGLGARRTMCLGAAMNCRRLTAMRRIWLAGAIGAATLLAACGGGNQEPTPSASTEDVGTAAPAEGSPAATEMATPTAPASSASQSAAPTAAPPKMAAAVAPDVFKQCQACHSAEPGKNGIGPSLAGVYGTKAGDVAGFDFSDAMKNSGLKWDAATLDKYLTSPQTVVPGTRMAFAGLKDSDKRQAVIAYLKAIK
jgi:cytochrome c